MNYFFASKCYLCLICPKKEILAVYKNNTSPIIFRIRRREKFGFNGPKELVSKSKNRFPVNYENAFHEFHRSNPVTF